MAKIYSSIGQLVGNTPLLRLANTERKLGLQATVLAKLERFNPAGSVKDRVAWAMIEQAEESGALKKGGVIIEPTSGNTGVGLAAVAAARGYKVIIVMPDSLSYERRMLIKAYGAQLVLTDGKQGMSGAIQRAEELKKEYPSAIIAGQFTNPVNVQAHYLTTGREIYEDTDGNVDVLVAGVGTGGTISGAGRYLKEKNPAVKVVAVEPANSAVLSGERAGAHGLQGIGAGFVPDIMDVSVCDEIVKVTEAEAYEAGKFIAQNEGMLVGISSGAAAHAAFTLARRREYAGKTIVVIFPDTGERYLSTDMFKD